MTTDTLRRKCRKLAAELGCTIEYERDIDVYWCYGPNSVYLRDDGDDRVDPFDGNHNHASWEEVWDALQVYQRDLQAAEVNLSGDVPDEILHDARVDAGLEE